MAKLTGILLMGGALAACGIKDKSGIASPQRTGSSQAERAYWAPPTLVSASRVSGGRIGLIGTGDPGSRIRLATPSGQVTLATADSRGFWRMVIPGATELRLFGLSMSQAARTIQAQGYLAATPGGEFGQLRAGAGALVIPRSGAGLRISAIDFDAQGAAVVSGFGVPSRPVAVAVDGEARGGEPADGAGRFTMGLEPLSPGDHSLAVTQGAAHAQAVVSVSPAAPLAGPFRAERTQTGWRIDWLTPGGGIQTTLLVIPGEPSS